MAKESIIAVFEDNAVVTENSNEARELFNKNRFGSLLSDGRIKLSLYEALLLKEMNKLELLDKRNKGISVDIFLKKARKFDKTFMTCYLVFKDLRKRGYVVKTALKFGANFRVYDRGKKPGEEHAKWVVFPVHESQGMTWHEFSAKARVAHSTKKRLLIAVVDDEGDVSYWENRWIRP